MQEVRRYGRLKGATPPHLVAEVDRLWNALIEVRFGLGGASALLRGGRLGATRPTAATKRPRVLLPAFLTRPSPVAARPKALTDRVLCALRAVQARYACELMASRGVRVAKDVTREWSEMSGHLIQRLEAHETAAADMQVP